ncbi:MAG: PDZ domain-containing protein [Candidatus Eremiobacteraeota bacterium]|nr:PDZ domain-containing protein [Candidatus Eremiobacteraeota bacterium]
MPPRNRVLTYIVAAFVAAAISFAPTPYSLILPGSAIDVRDVLTVDGHKPPVQHYYMTDVTLQERVSPLLLLQGFLPGARIVHTEEVVPKGVTIPQFDDIMKHAMNESQSIAAVVAERAANLGVKIPDSSVSIARFDPTSRAQSELQPGDVLRTVNGKPVSSTVTVQNALFKLKPGDPVNVTYLRKGRLQSARVITIENKGQARLGVYLLATFDAPHLAVPVKFKPFNVSGSSGGLMFAMDIYRTLKPSPSPVMKIAGTGTISYDGIVGPIEGAPQKLIAARRAGATMFFVPRENYNEIAGSHEIKIVPVHTFDEALKALAG